MGTGFRTATSGGVAAPPYTNGPYTFSEDITFEGAVTISGTMIFGDASVDTLTIGGTATISSNNKFYFRDTGLYLWSSADGQFDAVADTVFKVTAPTVELEASTAITLDGDVALDGAHTFGTGTGAVSLNGDVTVAAGKTLYIRDASQSIASASDDLMTLTSPTLTFAGATKINLDGPVDVSGALVLDTGATTLLTISADGTTGISITSGFSGTTGISFAGTATDGIAISGACTDAIDITGACTNALNIPVSAATTCAVLIGAGIGAGAGMVMSGTKNGLVRAFGEITTTAALSNDVRGGWFRVRQDADVDLTGGYSAVGLQGTYKMYGGSGGTTSTLWNNSGVYGSFESDGVASSNVASGGLIAGVYGQLGLLAEFTISSGAIAAAVAAMSNCNSSATATGSFAGVYVGRAISSSAKAFTTGVQIESSSCTTGISVGICTTGISLSGAATTGIGISYVGATASAKALSTVGFTLNDGNLTDGYGSVEVDLTLTGTVAGAVAGLSSWINMATVTTGSNYVCAQTNGLWSDSGCVGTNGVFIFGMRAQCLMQTNGGVVGAKFYPFSVVNNTNITTAIFKCNAGSSDLGTTAVSKTTEGKYVPLYEDDAGVHYVLIYN